MRSLIRAVVVLASFAGQSLAAQERFDISVPEEDLENVGTVGQAVDLVMAKVAAKA